MKKRSNRLKSAIVRVSVLILAAAYICVTTAFAAETPEVTAEGAIVIDCQTGEVYYQKASDTPRHAASMTKVMSVYLVLEEVKAGRLSFSTPVNVSPYASRISRDLEYSGLEDLHEGASYPVDTLLKLVMTASCNGSMIALAEHVAGSEPAFVDKMNTKAVEWGVSAHYADCTGYRDEGNAVSPRAQAEIARRAINEHPEILKYSSLKSTVFQGETFYSTNRLLREGTFQGIDGLKTGTTTAAGYCFTGTASRNGRRIISVVMASENSAARISDSAALLEYGFSTRTNREALWPKDASGINVALSSAGGISKFSRNELRATVTGVGAVDIPCEVKWAFGGKGYPSDVQMVADGKVLSFTAEPPFSAGNGLAGAAVSIRLPNGVTARQTAIFPVNKEPLTFSGAMGISSATLYPGMSLRIPCVVRCNQGLSCIIPVGWYLDGAAVPNYQNTAFKCTPSCTSAYILSTNGLAPGKHTLELRVNPEKVEGITPASFSATLEVVAGQPDLVLPAA